MPRPSDTSRAALAAGALVAHVVVSKSLRDAFFVSVLDVRRLPVAVAASAVLSFGAMLAASALLRRWSPARLVPWAFAVTALLELAAWAGSKVAPEIAAVVVYLQVTALGGTLVSIFWSSVNEAFDPHAAKKAVARINTGGTLGGVAGGLVAWGAGHVISVPGLLWISAGLAAFCALSLRCNAALRETSAPVDPPKVERARGLNALARTPLLQRLALLTLAASIAQELVQYAFTSRVAADVSTCDGLLGYFALVQTAIGIASFGVQLTLTRRVLDRVGLAGAIAALPMAVFGVGALALLGPSLVWVTLANGVDAVVRASLFRSGYELFYTPVDPQDKRPFKAFVDVGADRLGTLLGGGLLSGLLALGGTSRVILGGALLAYAACLGIAVLLHRAYVATLSQRLCDGTLKMDPEAARDATTRRTLSETLRELDRKELLEQIAELRATTHEPQRDDRARLRAIARATEDLVSGDEARIRRVLAEETALHGALATHLIALLAEDHVARPVAHALADIAPSIVGQLVDASGDPARPLLVRARAVRILGHAGTVRAVAGLLEALDSDAFEVRRGAALALQHVIARRPALGPDRERVLQAVEREIARGLRDARHVDHVFTLLALTFPPEPLELARRALRSGDARLRGTALEYLHAVLPEDIRASLLPSLGAPPDLRPQRGRAEVLDDLLRTRTQAPASGP